MKLFAHKKQTDQFSQTYKTLRAAKDRQKNKIVVIGHSFKKGLKKTYQRATAEESKSRKMPT